MCLDEGSGDYCLAVNIQKLKVCRNVLCVFCGAYYSSRRLLSYSSGESNKFTICPVCRYHTFLSENPIPEELDV